MNTSSKLRAAALLAATTLAVPATAQTAPEPVVATAPASAPDSPPPSACDFSGSANISVGTLQDGDIQFYEGADIYGQAACGNVTANLGIDVLGRNGGLDLTDPGARVQELSVTFRNAGGSNQAVTLGAREVLLPKQYPFFRFVGGNLPLIADERTFLTSVYNVAGIEAVGPRTHFFIGAKNPLAERFTNGVRLPEPNGLRAYAGVSLTDTVGAYALTNGTYDRAGVSYQKEWRSGPWTLAVAGEAAAGRRIDDRSHVDFGAALGGYADYRIDPRTVIGGTVQANTAMNGLPASVSAEAQISRTQGNFTFSLGAGYSTNFLKGAAGAARITYRF